MSLCGCTCAWCACVRVCVCVCRMRTLGLPCRTQRQAPLREANALLRLGVSQTLTRPGAMAVVSVRGGGVLVEGIHAHVIAGGASPNILQRKNILEPRSACERAQLAHVDNQNSRGKPMQRAGTDRCPEGGKSRKKQEIKEDKAEQPKTD